MIETVLKCTTWLKSLLSLWRRELGGIAVGRSVKMERVTWPGCGSDGVWEVWGVCRLPECGARRDRWKRVGGPATAPPGTAGMKPTRLGCWDRERALWAHLWKEEEEEWSEERDPWKGEWLQRESGWWAESGACGGAALIWGSFLFLTANPNGCSFFFLILSDFFLFFFLRIKSLRCKSSFYSLIARKRFRTCTAVGHQRAINIPLWFFDLISKCCKIWET